MFARTISLVAVIFIIMVAIFAAFAVIGTLLVLGGLAVMLTTIFAAAVHMADPEVMTEAMRQADPASQAQVIREIGELGPDAEPFMLMLKERFEVGEPEVQAAALEALKKIDPEQWGHLP